MEALKKSSEQIIIPEKSLFGKLADLVMIIVVMIILRIILRTILITISVENLFFMNILYLMIFGSIGDIVISFIGGLIYSKRIKTISIRAILLMTMFFQFSFGMGLRPSNIVVLIYLLINYLICFGVVILTIKIFGRKKTIDKITYENDSNLAKMYNQNYNKEGLEEKRRSYQAELVSEKIESLGRKTNSVELSSSTITQKGLNDSKATNKLETIKSERLKKIIEENQEKKNIKINCNLDEKIKLSQNAKSKIITEKISKNENMYINKIDNKALISDQNNLKKSIERNTEIRNKLAHEKNINVPKLNIDEQKKNIDIKDKTEIEKQKKNQIIHINFQYKKNDIIAQMTKNGINALKMNYPNIIFNFSESEESNINMKLKVIINNKEKNLEGTITISMVKNAINELI